MTFVKKQIFYPFYLKLVQVFKFKQFEVDQTGCAMRINTDGVLLGAMVEHDNPVKILDIGTGTGVISLMLAQRFKQAQVLGIEIDVEAAGTADRNFKNSSFNERLTAVQADFLDYEAVEQFDLIVSNPPFFTNDLKNPEPKKELARHTSDAFFEILISKSASLLTDNGLLWLVLPPDQIKAYAHLFKAAGLYQQCCINLCSFEGKLPFRKIVAYSRNQTIVLERDFILYERPGIHTGAYKAGLKDFFIAF